MSSLGYMYVTGRGVPQDYGEAVRWYRDAAEQGHVGAQTYAGWMYEAGQGVSQDHIEAAFWYQKAADQGDAYAQFSLGCMFENGDGVPHDDAKAVQGAAGSALEFGVSLVFFAE